METSDSQPSAAQTKAAHPNSAEQLNKKQHEEKKGSRTEENKNPNPKPLDEEEDENPFGGISGRNLKKNLGCGG